MNSGYGVVHAEDGSRKSWQRESVPTPLTHRCVQQSVAQMKPALYAAGIVISCSERIERLRTSFAEQSQDRDVVFVVGKNNVYSVQHGRPLYWAELLSFLCVLYHGEIQVSFPLKLEMHVHLADHKKSRIISVFCAYDKRVTIGFHVKDSDL